MLECALAAGLMSSGASVCLSGVVTTPELAFLIKEEGFFGGAMISASHNVYSDNGIKLFSFGGEKLCDTISDKIEDYIDGILGEDIPACTGDKIGRILDFSSDKYENFLKNASDAPLDGMNIALDCANGSTYRIAKRVFSSLGAHVKEISCTPDGKNINFGCGSTHIEALSSFVRKGNFDVGFAFDGDGDRCIAVDPLGRELCGDRMMYLLARYFSSRNELPKDAIAVTVMSNLGLHLALEREKIRCVQCPVGDRYVWENMQKYNLYLGGEQSGHVILRKYLHTGDGILTAIKALNAARYLGLGFSELYDCVPLLGQVLLNVRVKDKGVAHCSSVQRELENIRVKLSGRGRVILRPSGTEQIIRVMVEAENKDECRNYAEKIAEIIRCSEVEKP
jgi:phosphoglucosamine mutase